MNGRGKTTGIGPGLSSSLSRLSSRRAHTRKAASYERVVLRRVPGKGSAVTLTGCLLVLTLLFEIALPMPYFAMMFLLIFIGPGGLTPPWWIAIGTYITAGTLLFVSFWGVGFCFFG